MTLINKLAALKSNIFGSPPRVHNPKPPASTVQDIKQKESPTGILNEDPLRFSTLTYPLDTQVNYQNGHYMLFYVNVQERTKYTYQGGASDENKKRIDNDLKGASEKETRYKKLRELKRQVYDTSDKAVEDRTSGTVTYSTQTIYDHRRDEFETRTVKRSNTTNAAKLGVSSNFNFTKRITDSVSLYLPPNVEETTSAKYDESATGLAGFLVSKFSKDELRGMDAAQLTRKVGGGLEGIAKDVTFKALGLAGELVGAEGVEALARKAFGEANNPYMEVLFDSMQLRSFSYNFNFMPRNEEEALEVQKIIQLFRFHMAPELRPNVNRYLGLPSQFDIHYMYLSKEGVASENNYYNRIATCVLQDCKVNYTPNGVKSFEDGGPVQTTMTLTFKEIELLTKDKIAQGY